MMPGSPAIAGALIVRKINRIIQTFHDHFAYDNHTAMTKEQLGFHSFLLVRMLISRGVIKETSDGRYYLDQAETQNYLAARKRRALITLTFVCIIALFIIYFYKT